MKTIHTLILLCIFTFQLENAKTQTTVTIGTGTTTSVYPFYNLFENGKTQILYLGSEISATSTTISSLAFDIKTVAGASYRSFSNFTINIKHTSSTSFGTAYESMAGSTTVFYENPYNMPSSTGWITFDIDDFSYNGTSNLIIEIIWGDNNGIFTYSPYYEVNSSTNASFMVTYGYADSETPPSYDGRTKNRPNIKFTLGNNNPTLTTTTATLITTTTTSTGGNVTSDGGASVTARGVCYGTSAAPTISGTKTTDGSGTGSFTSSLSGLSAQTLYYYRAYATNTVGTSYGTEYSFYTLSTAPSSQAASFTATAANPNQINLTFSAASSCGADGYIILVKASNSAPASTGVTNGIAPALLSGYASGVSLVTTITNNSTISYSHMGITSNTQYYYIIIPFNWNESNTETYNYYTAGTIASATATTPTGPSNEGFYIAGNVANNGTIIGTNDDNYMRMTGSSKTISGTGTWTNVKFFDDGAVTFNGTISSGKFSETFINSSKTLTINSEKTFKNGLLTNYGTFTFTGTAATENSGNWINYSTVTCPTTSLITFNGTVDQSITSGCSSFGSVTMANSLNGSGGAVLQDAMTITGTLTLTTGIIRTGSYTMTLGTSGVSGNATVSGGSSNSYIVAYDNNGTIGAVKSFVNTNTSYSFPIGDLTNYTPLTYTQSSATLSSAFLTVYTKAIKIPGMNSTISNYANRFWEVTPSGITNPTYDISYSYATGDIVGSEINFLPVKKSGTQWYKPTNSSFTTGLAQGSGTTNAGTNTLTWTGLSTFSTFGAAGDQGIVLPLTLVKFDAKPYQGNVKLSWETASEVNNDEFTVERSLDGQLFDGIGVLDGAGNSSHTIKYFMIDDRFEKKVLYYRLKLKDFDGIYTYSDIASVDMSQTPSQGILIMTVNTFGQEVKKDEKGIVFDIYSDGTSIKRINL